MKLNDNGEKELTVLPRDARLEEKVNDRPSALSEETSLEEKVNNEPVHRKSGEETGIFNTLV